MDIVTLLVAGAAVASTTAVQEATKSAYNGLKARFAELFGGRGSDALAAVEAAPNDPASKTLLAATVGTLTAADVAKLQPFADALINAFRQDEAARNLARSAAVRIEVDAQGDIIIERIEGPHVLDVKATSGGDFRLSDLKMGTDPGN